MTGETASSASVDPTRSSGDETLHCELVLIRHGERADQVSDDPWNRTRQPRPRDPPLTLKGRAQAQNAASSLIADNYLQSLFPPVVYCSPLTRCLQTAAPIAAALNVPIHVLYALGEPCKYFRTMRRLQTLPEIPHQNEIPHILRDAHPSATLSAYTPNDRSTCKATLQRLAHDALKRFSCSAQEPQSSFHHSRISIVVVGHREAQVELARFCHVPIRGAPVGGRATFSLLWHLSDLNRDTQARSPQWTMIESPLEYAHRIQQDLSAGTASANPRQGRNTDLNDNCENRRTPQRSHSLGTHAEQG